MSKAMIAITSVANVFLMMFIGFGGLGESESLMIPVTIYFGAVFIWLYVLMAWCPSPVRTKSLIGVSVPWAFLCLSVLPQFPKEPGSVSLMIGCMISLWILRFPGEVLSRRLTRAFTQP